MHNSAWGDAVKVFRGPTADNVWQQAFCLFSADSDATRSEVSRGGDTVEILHTAFEIDDPRQRWVVSRHPTMNPAFSIAEVLWILVGENNADFLNYWFPGLPKYAGYGQSYSGAYGYRLRRHFSVDQLLRACDALSSDASSRQVVLQYWDAGEDLPNPDGTPRNADVPCNISSLLKVRAGRLEWAQIMRSNDLNRGFPYNVVQFTVLQEVIAGWLDVVVGRYHHWSDSLHVYKNDEDKFSVEPPDEAAENTDSLAIDFTQGVTLLDELYQRARELTKPDLTETRLDELTSLSGVPVGYQNLMCVLGAESARKRVWADQSRELITRSTNPQIQQVWAGWLSRFE